MSDKQEKSSISRRGFLKTVGAAGIGTTLGASQLFAAKDANTPKDPNSVKLGEAKFEMRDFGNKGFKVPCFSLGVMFDATANIAVLRKALQLGVTLWDCAYSYGNGNSEKGIGQILAEQPDLKKKLFITSKSSGGPTDLENHLQESLKRINRDYIDIYYIHGLGNPSGLTDEIKAWAESAKKRKLIRFFGFSTHSNMAGCLNAAAQAGWIDAILTTYNFQVMQDPELSKAVDACVKAGVALMAMKTQARMPSGDNVNPKVKEAIEYFTKKGFSEGQAKTKAVLSDKRIASTTLGIGRGNIEQLVAGVDAVLDPKGLDKKDVAFLTDYARKTCDGYCAGCANICMAAAPSMPYVADVMRYLMYYNSYDMPEMAREHYAQLPADIRARIASVDYSLAERNCPNRMPIAKLMNEAASKLA
jgi:predicted aldo/keto reductase-like oxidoreductase